ncbi:MAG: hypothetical protein HQL32_07965 [Planctomycetes bacterium]|nr:hypothetical protein [Planctomycetota bacterium]
MNAYYSFFDNNIPTVREILYFGPLFLAYAIICLGIAGYAKKKKRIKTGYSRKLFHFLIFFSAALIHSIWGIRYLCLFGSCTSLSIFYAIYRGKGFWGYDALAREKDAPLETLYIITPYLATLLGGLFANIYWGPLAIFGYLVTGLGDAVGELVGTRWGRHTYKAPSLSQVKATRSLEGSFAVWLVSFLALICCAYLFFQWPFSLLSLTILAFAATASALAEALSPHGWDNLTMQVLPVYLISLFDICAMT